METKFNLAFCILTNDILIYLVPFSNYYFSNYLNHMKKTSMYDLEEFNL